jgi:malate dehydrogenase
MRRVAIIGAGELGGQVCHALARRDLVSSILLIDENESVAKGKALDISQAAPIETFATSIAGSSDFYAAAAADAIVIADRAGGSEWHGEEALALVRRFAQLSAGSAIVCAGATQRELVEHAVREIRIPRKRVAGSAPEALASAVRALVAIETNGSTRDVSLTVVGTPPGHVVVPWEEAAIAGRAATSVLDEVARRRVTARIAALWPPEAHALAVACLRTIEGFLGRSRRVVSCFVGPDDSSGRRDRATALPVQLGQDGLSVVLPPLNPVDRVVLENAMQL